MTSPAPTTYLVVARSTGDPFETYSTPLYSGDDLSDAHAAYREGVDIAKAHSGAEVILYEQPSGRRKHILPGYHFIASEWRAAQARPAVAIGEALQAVGQALGGA